MNVAAGEIVFNLGKSPCSGAGLLWTAAELDAALKPVASVVFDDVGKAEVEEILAGLVETEFGIDNLQRILKTPQSVEDWRVGEAIAECYLASHRVCTFPWPDSRDERKAGSSLPGADLVGFVIDANGDCLTFGEVKTSTEGKYPPGAMHGRTGLKQQLEDLRDRVEIRDKLLEYLCVRAKGKEWRPRFEAAAKRYLHNKSDVRLFGILIRDVAPNGEDLRVRVEKLAMDLPSGTSIELLAVYLPSGSIAELGRKVVEMRKGGTA